MNSKKLGHKFREIKNFPKKGVSFKDITKLIQDKEAFGYAIKKLKEYCKSKNPDIIVGIESRGFIFSAPVAVQLGLGLAIIRKSGKLPFEKIREDYNYEYSSGSLEIHTDSITPGQRVAIVDDILATGGTALAAKKLIERLGGNVVCMGFLAELSELNGSKKLGVETKSLLKFGGDTH